MATSSTTRRTSASSGTTSTTNTERQPAKCAHIRTVEVPIAGAPVTQPVLDIDGDSDTQVEDMLVGEADPQARAREIKLSKAKYMELAGAIDRAWAEMGKPATVAAGLFNQVVAGYNRDAITRAKVRLQIQTKPAKDPISRKFTSHIWQFRGEFIGSVSKCEQTGFSGASVHDRTRGLLEVFSLLRTGVGGGI